jgi:hypothetical protein
MLDLLRQHLTGLVKDTIGWIRSLLKQCKKLPILTGKRSKKDNADAHLDRRFDEIPTFPNLKHFEKFSEVKQWTGNEHKHALRQLIPVVTPPPFPARI